MKTILTLALLMMSSTMLFSAPGYRVSNLNSTSIESVSNSDKTAIPAAIEKSINDCDGNGNSENDQCSWNSRIELRGRLILEKKYNLYT